MLTDVIATANLKDVAESAEEQIKKIGIDMDEFTRRYKQLRTEKEDILMSKK